MRVKIKAKTYKALIFEIYAKQAKGWIAINIPKRNWFGKWVVRMKKLKE